MHINYCEMWSDMNYGLFSATRLNQKDFQSMLHDLLNTICQNLNNSMDKQNIGDLQCIVWHNNNRTKGQCWSKVPFSDLN